jgi:nitroimidazol reductase NimA-like FMN-containing flavoprotein (pyridoxamine 5'-phosphate oxidase superfamily)
MNSLPNPGSTPKTINRRTDREITDRDVLYSILDEALVCHVGFTDEDNQPFVLPMGFARVEDSILLHGSTGSRLMRRIGSGIPICVEVTLFDGLVLAKSSFESSMNYRSAVVFGKGEIIEDDRKDFYLNKLTDKLAPNRSSEIRSSTKKELAATLLVSVPLLETSVKIRTGAPKEAESDIDSKTWSGVIPFKLIATTPIPGDDFSEKSKFPGSVESVLKNYN